MLRTDMRTDAGISVQGRNVPILLTPLDEQAAKVRVEQGQGQRRATDPYHIGYMWHPTRTPPPHDAAHRKTQGTHKHTTPNACDISQ